MTGTALRRWTVSVVVSLTLVVPGWAASLLPAAKPVPVIMLSDLHFDPYRDPAKLAALRSAPVLQWAKILGDPDAKTQATDYKNLQTACHARGIDSSWSVVKSSLQAARVQQPSPLFVTVSGDLLVHNFDCRLRTLEPHATDADVSAFAAKTVQFLAMQMHEAFPHSPVYLAMGNNDSGCRNYHQTPNSDFVKQVDATTAAEFTAQRDQKTVLKAFSERGDYSVLLPKSMHDTRLIVLQDVVQSPEYGDCGGGSGADEKQAQIDWLREQLISARQDKQKVWVMAHIPPGVDAYASFHKYISAPEKMCTATAPTMMMSSDKLAETLTEYARIVKLAIFAHTHMDEIKLLRNKEGISVAAKLVPSISPVNGNVPAFLVASVQPQTAVLLDYKVIAANDVKATSWGQEYRYSTTYHMPDFSADSVAQIASRLAKDRTGSDELSTTYARWFLAGDDGTYARGLKAIWPGYACAIVEDGGPGFQECLCPASANEAKTKTAP